MTSATAVYGGRRLTRDWRHVLVDDIEENVNTKRTTRKKTLANEISVDSYGDILSVALSNTDIQFVTGSTYEGQRSKTGVEGFGTYTFPHGVVYEGQFKDGMFHGKGLLFYPQGQALNCTYENGKLMQWEYLFAPPQDHTEEDAGLEVRKGSRYSQEFDRLKTEGDMDLATYCQPPDRRFYKSYSKGLQGAPHEFLTDDKVPRAIPKGCYDMEDGFYNPRTKWVHGSSGMEKILYMAPVNKQRLNLATNRDRRKFVDKIPNIPVYKTESWILEHCRKSWDEKVGYKPELYEYWFSGRKAERQRLNMRTKDKGGKFIREKSKCEEALKYFESVP